MITQQDILDMQETQRQVSSLTEALHINSFHDIPGKIDHILTRQAKLKSEIEELSIIIEGRHHV